jgi:hypothetical protein
MTAPKGVKEAAQQNPKVDEKSAESDILSAILAESHRPNAIVSILNKKYDQNTVLKTLLILEKQGKVERDTKKAWIAKGGAKKEQKKKEKEKAKPKDKVSDTEKEKQE